MAERRFFSTRKTHFDEDKDMVPEWGEGVDTIKFKVPSGYKYDRYELKKLPESTLLAEARVIAKPSRNAKGDQQIKVKWSYPIFGKIRYALHCYAVKEGERGDDLVIPISDKDWYDRAMQAIEQRKRFTLRLIGDEAVEFWRFIAGGKASVSGERATVVDDQQSKDAGWEVSEYSARADGGATIVITIAVVMGIIAVAALATICVVLLTAINNKCEATATNGGSITNGDFRVDIKVSGCQGQ